MAQPEHLTREGYQWTPSGGLQPQLPSIGVVKPSTNLSSEKVHDVIVIGAGYCGLTASRDLSVAGRQVLLLEARDRIGGRTWSSNIDGYPFEMGGTWVHWHQPFVWREIARHGLTSQVKVSPVTGQGIDQAWIHRQDGTILKLDHEKEVLSAPYARTRTRLTITAEQFAVLASAMEKFHNVDGRMGRDAVPLPYDLDHNPVVEQYDKMSLADRMKEVEHDLSPLERELLEGILSINTGGTLENSSFLDMLRWWAVNNYDMGWYNALCLTYKLKLGQSDLARRVFEEALGTGKLEYCFDTPISSVEDCDLHVVVTSRSGQQFKARRVITTVPLNVLSSISFTPPLLPGKKEASDLGHVNHCTKVHAEVANPDLRSFSGWMHHRPLAMVSGDGTTPSGNTHLVCFGPSFDDVRLDPTANGGQDALDAIRNAAPEHIKDIKRLVFHDWNADEFAKGTWEFLRPGMATKYMDSLRQRQGNMLFASADWATGWRGFIDGAIEDGGRVAKDINDEFTRAMSEGQAA